MHDVMRSSEVTAREKELTLALALNKFQMQRIITPEVRLALVEATLRITDHSHPNRPEWLTQLVAIYIKIRHSGAASDWRGSFGMTRDEALGHFAQIRQIRRYPDFVDPAEERSFTASKAPTLPVGVSSNLKVSRVELEGFRAAPGSIGLDFTINNKPSSIVIFGDNGVGKSTLVNAIELACQGTVGRLPLASADSGLTLINLSMPRDWATVAVTLTDGTRLERTVKKVNGQWQASGSQTPFEFSLSPLTLQRTDLVRFLSTPGSQRGQLFVGHFVAESMDGYSRTILERAKTAKITRQQFVQDLAGRAGHPPRVGLEYVVKMLQTIHMNGSSEKQWQEIHHRLPTEYVAERNRYREIEREVSESRTLAKQLPAAKLQDHVRQVKRLGELLGDVGASLTEALVMVTGYSFIESVNVKVGGAGALSLQMEVHLRNGVHATPEQIFSEGVQDLLAILFFLEVAKASAARGQAKVLVLDDVIQSVDATIRRRLLHHIVTDLKSWQLIITCHDRLWRDHVREALHKGGVQHREIVIRSWNFEGGPVVTTSQSDASVDLRQLIRQATPRAVAGTAGLLLETICDRLSWTLPTTVTRARGDLYTLGTLWDSVSSKVKKSPELSKHFAEINHIVSLRNQLGAHYNEIANSIADTEADRFGDLVLELWDCVYCKTCSDYVDKLQSKFYSCRCGMVKFTT
ncbi:AAA family ATPase [Saccharothrix stipae]